MYVCAWHIRTGTTCLQVPSEVRKGCRDSLDLEFQEFQGESSDAGAGGGGKGWASPGLLEEHQVLITTEASLQLPQ